MFVVGDPKFYTRFGFDPALAKGFTSRYSGPHLMALAFGRELPTPERVIGYASAFETHQVGLASKADDGGNRSWSDRGCY